MKKTLILGLIAMMALVANADNQKKCACDNKCKTEKCEKCCCDKSAKGDKKACCDSNKKCDKKADAQTGATKQM